MNFNPNIVTTLVGGPCDGQEIPESFFDGRPQISVAAQKPLKILPLHKKSAADSTLDLHQYLLREACNRFGYRYVVFAYPSMSDADVFRACETLIKKLAPDTEI